MGDCLGIENKRPPHAWIGGLFGPGSMTLAMVVDTTGFEPVIAGVDSTEVTCYLHVPTKPGA